MTFFIDEFYFKYTIYVCTDTYTIWCYLLSANLDLIQELTDIKKGWLRNITPVVNLNDDYDKEYNSLDGSDDCAVSNRCLVEKLEAEKDLDYFLKWKKFWFLPKLMRTVNTNVYFIVHMSRMESRLD